jgi:hypothetical protein
MISYLFANIVDIGSPNMFVYGAFVFVTVYAYTDLMDKHTYALMWELLKASFGVAIIYYFGDWFGSQKYWPWINYLVVAYLIASLLIAASFIFFEFRTGKVVTSMSVAQQV